MPVSDPKTQAAYAIFQVWRAPADRRAEAQKEAETFAQLHSAEEFGLCPGHWRLFSNGVGQCLGGDCVLNNKASGVSPSAGPDTMKKGTPPWQTKFYHIVTSVATPPAGQP